MGVEMQLKYSANMMLVAVLVFFEWIYVYIHKYHMQGGLDEYIK